MFSTAFAIFRRQSTPVLPRRVLPVFFAMAMFLPGWVIADNLKEIALTYNDATASYLIAEKYYKGHGAEQNFQQALQWYTKAAELGHGLSKQKLGEMYFYGEGTQRKLSLAAKWLLDPAEQGQSDAQHLLGLIYQKGENPDLPKNDAQALFWFKKAAEDHHADAAYQAGSMYYLGLGVAADPGKAKTFLNLAAENGNTPARQLLARIATEEKRMSAAQPAQSGTVAKSQSSPEAKMAELKQRAQNGESGAQLELAEIYFFGTEQQTFDVNSALQWYEQAALNGHAVAQFKLGMFHYYGQIVPKDWTQARRWFERAAAQSHAEAKELLALLDTKTAVKKSSPVELMMEQAQKGDKDAQYELGLMYLNGGVGTQDSEPAVAQNSQLALKWFMAAAVQDHVEAQFQAGMIYFNPESSDNNQAEQWLIKAASKQHPEAQYYLGSLYETQNQVDKAVQWLDLAVANDHDNALDMLLMLLLDQRIPSADKDKVMRWLEKAAQKGYLEAQFRLGDQYVAEMRAGDLSEATARKAHDWLSKAAAKGHVQAQYQLGLIYKEGLGVNRHYIKSSGWLRRAAESGQVDAQFELGEMYRLGLGLPKKETLAEKWYQMAADQGHMEARMRLSNRGRY